MAPAAYTLGHDSLLLTGGPARTVVDTPTAVVPVAFDVQPTPELTRQVHDQLTGFLDACATQRVLQPAGCPFGIALDDRLVDEPTWAMLDIPRVVVVPNAGEWQSPPASGSARVAVTVQSLLKSGKTKTVDKTVPLSVRLRIEIRPDESLSITVS